MQEYREIYEFLQRKTSKGRREGTAFYIEDRIDGSTDMPGAFPAIAIGMVRPPKFESAKEGCGLAKEVGILQLDLSESNKRILLDGLARLTGALDFETKTGKTELFSFPLTIYDEPKARCAVRRRRSVAVGGWRFSLRAGFGRGFFCALPLSCRCSRQPVRRPP